MNRFKEPISVGIFVVVMCGILSAAFAAQADAHPPKAEVPILNAQFEKGHDGSPEGWRLTHKDGGDWLRNAGRDGGAAIRVTGIRLWASTGRVRSFSTATRTTTTTPPTPCSLRRVSVTSVLRGIK